MSKHLEMEMDSLKDKLLELTNQVETSLRLAVQVLKEKKLDRARKVVELDDVIDRAEVAIEEDCLKILALHQPVAIDLRYLIGALKLNNDLERIGDLAVNIAERAHSIALRPEVSSPLDLGPMADSTISMLERAIRSLFQLDIELARQVILDDNKIDQMNRDMYAKVFAAIKEHPEHVDVLVNYLSASRHLERIADYTTNIAEDVIYMIDGQIVRHKPEFM